MPLSLLLRRTPSGAIIIVAFVTATGVVFDYMSRRYLSEVTRHHFKNYEARLRAEAETAEAKHRFITTISHEVRCAHPLHV